MLLVHKNIKIEYRIDLIDAEHLTPFDCHLYPCLEALESIF